MALTELAAAIDAELQGWQQGDVLLTNEVPFIYLADFSRAVTPQSQQIAATSEPGSDPIGSVFVNVPGLAILTQTCDLIRSCLTQTCDLIRSCSDRPLVRVAALAPVSVDVLDQVRRGHRTRYAFIPGVADRALVADLDGIMTIEKAFLASLPEAQRIRGCNTDDETRDFAMALSRNASRTAFPDDFVLAFREMRRRIIDKHGKPTKDGRGKSTNEGKLLAAVREIRVACTPSWTATKVEDLTFYFVFERREDITSEAEEIVSGLVGRFKSRGTFREPAFRLVTLTEMSAATYLSSDPLDLDQLSHTADDEKI